MGARLSQNYDTGFQRFSFGSTLEIKQIEGSPNLGRRRNVAGSVWAKEELTLSDFMTLAGFGRYDRYMNKSYTGIGADATLKIIKGLSLFAGASRSARLPTYEELYWTDSSVTRTMPILAEKHLQLETGAEFTFGDNSFLRASYFHRTVDDAIQIVSYSTPSIHVSPALAFTNVPQVVTSGIEAKVGLRIWVVYLEGVGTYMIQSSGGFDTQLFPHVWANGGIYYWKKLLKGKLELKVGFKGRYQSSHLGAEFNPELLAYVLSKGPALGQAASGDFFLSAHIGDAYIHFVWENLTSVQYFSTPFYPILDREIRIGVSWEFLN
jgi:outer membrane receptor protein involved in Fe transport